MVAIRKIFRKTITYILIGVLTVTSLTSLFTSDVYADEIITDDNPYKGNPDNVFDLMKNSWYYTVTQLGFFVNDMCTFDLNSIGVGACKNKMDYEEWLSGHNMTADDVVDSYDASTGTVNLSINYVKNVYNDVLDAVQEDEGWYWSSGKSPISIFKGYDSDMYNYLYNLYQENDTVLCIPFGSYDNGLIMGHVFDFFSNHFFINSNNFSKSSMGYYYSYDKLTAYSSLPSDKDNHIGIGIEAYLDGRGKKIININNGSYLDFASFFHVYGSVSNLGNIRNYNKFVINRFFYGPKKKIFYTRVGLNKYLNDSNVLIQSVNDNLTNISIKLDDLNRDWLKVNNEIKDLIDDYMQDFQDYTDKQDKIDAAISSTLTTMNENLAAGKEDLIGAIKESSAVQQLWLERIYNKEVEIYTKYLEENEQTQAVLVGIANQMKEYFDSSLKNQGNYLTYEQFQDYAQQIIDAINSSGGSSGAETGGTTVDMSTVDEYIKKIYEKETDLYNKLNEISGKLDSINNNLTKYLWNADKSIPFLAEISTLVKDGFEKCTTPLSSISEKLDDLISLAKKILNRISVQNLIDTIDRTKSDDEEENASLLDLVACVLYAVLILGSLCDIFLKMLEYVILMFQIPAEPALFNEDILMGWNYAANIKIPNTDFGILQFLRLLVYITLIFGVVKALRRAIHNGSIDVIGK